MSKELLHNNTSKDSCAVSLRHLSFLLKLPVQNSLVYSLFDSDIKFSKVECFLLLHNY